MQCGKYTTAVIGSECEARSTAIGRFIFVKHTLWAQALHTTNNYTCTFTDDFAQILLLFFALVFFS